MLQTYLVKLKTDAGPISIARPRVGGRIIRCGLLLATAQLRYSHFLKQLEEREVLFSELRPFRLSDLREGYLRRANSQKSASWHSKHPGTILPFFGPDILRAQITPGKIEQYAEWRRTTVKVTTVNKELACIRCLVKEAEEGQHLASKPAGTGKELPDDGQVHEPFLMDRPALRTSKTEVEAS
jgi:hypothetical protein